MGKIARLKGQTKAIYALFKRPVYIILNTTTTNVLHHVNVNRINDHNDNHVNRVRAYDYLSVYLCMCV